MTKEQFDLCSSIIKENIEIINNPNEPEEFRESLKNEMLELKAELDKIIILYS